MTTEEDALSAYRQPGIVLLQHSLERPGALARGLDMTYQEVSAWKQAARIYFGPTRFTKKQQQAVRLADGYSVSRLLRIERFAKRVADEAERWRFRLDALAFDGTADELCRYLKSATEEQSIPPVEPKRGTNVIQHSENIWSFTMRDEPARIAQLLKSLDVTGSEERLDKMWSMLAEGGQLVEPAYRTVIAIGLDDFMKVIAGKGDDVILGCSDGTTMTGAEYLAHLLAGRMGQDMFAGLYHPTQGPVNLYECRAASFKQRILAISEQLACAWDNCPTPSDHCEVHHIVGHKMGGQTKPTNLTMLCKYHNGVIGSTDPTDMHGPRPKRGYVCRENGRVVYQPPGKEPPRTNPRPAAKRGAMALVQN
ncbi:MAG: HNH endonuclease [Corynebacterium camporealensis]|uniref:HNH endonuclease signature motif containing protein n=1 Tax=Corynebacterium camporealensis TaxID=161896 RepID=UPI002A917A0A|nr:HNH endonuclease [Corynebacterium camporealensis]MDY5839796.1 HNH endonuclease [Corynebacterium camporealensis]